MNTPFNEITIIIILYEEKEQLVLKCLENFKNFKIIIVDNSNNLALKKQVEKNYKIFKYVLNEKNYGYSKAANQAIKLSDTEFILMFQADGIIDQKDIYKLLDAHKKYENSFIVSPTLFDKEQKNFKFSSTDNLQKKDLSLELTIEILEKSNGSSKLFVIEPLSEAIIPDISLRSVVLPQPFLPKRAMQSPSFASNERPFKTVFLDLSLLKNPEEGFV